MKLIKEYIKRIIPVKIYNKFLLFKLFIHSKYSLNCKKKYINRKYKEIFGCDINWKNPLTYNEKINVSKLLCSTDEKNILSDKYMVRNWIKEKIGEEYLIPLIGVYEHFDEINFDDLPDKFVMKMNNDSGSVYLCENKKIIDYKNLKIKYDYLCKRNYAYQDFQMQYEKIKLIQFQ